MRVWIFFVQIFVQSKLCGAFIEFWNVFGRLINAKNFPKLFKLLLINFGMFFLNLNERFQDFRIKKPNLERKISSHIYGDCLISDDLLVDP